MKTNNCDWCQTEYPEFDKTVRYYQVVVFGKTHKICNECKEKLKLVEDEKSTAKTGSVEK